MDPNETTMPGDSAPDADGTAGPPPDAGSDASASPAPDAAERSAGASELSQPASAPESGIDGGQPQCKAKSKRSGVRCKKRAVHGYLVCEMHGAGMPVRVERGERKPPGHPVVSGAFADPERTRYGRLSELLEQAKSDAAGLRTAELELALCKACVQWQFEKLLAGNWDVMKTPELEAHPASWLIESASKVIDKVAKLNAMINRDRVHGMVALIDPVINVVLTVIEQHVPADSRVVARETVRKKLSAILVPT